MASCNDTNIVCKRLISDAEPFFEMNDINVMVKPNLNPLKCISYNMHGFNQGKTFLEATVRANVVDIIFLQEHWLSNSTMYKLLNLCKPNFSCFTVSAMEDRIAQDVLFGRPFSGVAILVKNNIIHNVKCLLKNERCLILKIDDYVFVNVYFPSSVDTPVLGRDGSDTLNDMLQSISEIFEQFKECQIIFGGDTNCRAIQINDTKPALQFIYTPLEAFRKRFGLVFVDDIHKCSTNYTYKNESLGHYSKIDFFLVSKVLVSSVIDFHVIEYHSNFSDHLPIGLVVEVSTFEHLIKTEHENKSEIKTKFLRWDHGDRDGYYELTRMRLTEIDQDLNKVINDLKSGLVGDDRHEIIDRLYSDLIQALRQSSDQTIPNIKKGNLKFWWDQEMEVLKQNSIGSFRAWQSAGKPKFGDIHDQMKIHRLRYRKEIKDRDNQTVFRSFQCLT